MARINAKAGLLLGLGFLLDVGVLLPGNGKWVAPITQQAMDRCNRKKNVKTVSARPDPPGGLFQQGRFLVRNSAIVPAEDCESAKINQTGNDNWLGMFFSSAPTGHHPYSQGQRPWLRGKQY